MCGIPRPQSEAPPVPLQLGPNRASGALEVAAEVGHVHANGMVDIPFTRPVHDVLLAECLAEQHRWVQNSGWITFHIRGGQDIAHALWLMRLSYLRYALKDATDLRRLFEQESEELRLGPRFKSLLEPFVPKKARAVSAEPFPA